MSRERPGESVLAICYLRIKNERSSQGSITGARHGSAIVVASFRSSRPAGSPHRRRSRLHPQQPGAGAQVHTGTSSGLDADVRIQNLLADHQFFRLQSELDQLPPDQAQLYRGILANRNNDPKESIQLLEPLVDKVAASGDAAHEKLLRKALAEDYLRDGDLSKAAKAIPELLKAGCRAR